METEEKLFSTHIIITEGIEEINKSQKNNNNSVVYPQVVKGSIRQQNKKIGKEVKEVCYVETEMEQWFTAVYLEDLIERCTPAPVTERGLVTWKL